MRGGARRRTGTGHPSYRRREAMTSRQPGATPQDWPLRRPPASLLVPLRVVEAGGGAVGRARRAAGGRDGGEGVGGQAPEAAGGGPERRLHRDGPGAAPRGGGGGPFGAADGRRRAGRHHRVLPGHGDQPGRAGHGPRRRRHARRAADQGEGTRACPRRRRRAADRAVLRGQVLHPPARGRAAGRGRTGPGRDGRRPGGDRGRRGRRMSGPGDPRDAGATVSPWRGMGPELVIAAAVIVVAAAAGSVLGSWAGLSVAAAAAAAAAMAVLRFLLPALTPDQGKKAREKPQARPLRGYSQRRFMVQGSIASRGFYDGELRPGLEHLLP